MSTKKPTPPPRRRGRKPLSGGVIDKNKVIAHTVDQLIMWGFSGKGEVFEIVGLEAKKMGLRQIAGTALGPDSIKKIWEEHGPEGWERFWPPAMKEQLPKPKRRGLYTKRSLIATRPEGTVGELAEALLRNKGVWPLYEMEDYPYRGELELSPAWEKQLALCKLKSGVKK